MLLICFEWLFGTIGKVCDDKVAEIKDLLSDLMLEYHVEENKDNTESSTSSLGNMDFLSSFSACVVSKRPVDIWFKSELDCYLENELVPLVIKNFKVLDWW